MPSLRDPALDERFDELADQIRGARPRAAADLRDRVRATAAAAPPVAEPRLRRRRLAPILAFAAVVAIGVAVGVLGRSRGGADEQGAGGTATTAVAGAREAAPPGSGQALDESQAAVPQAPGALPPSPTRLQLYRAELTIRVGSPAELNTATRRAIRIARGLGGFVVSADLRTPSEGDARSVLVLRVPTTRAQAAYERFAGLGTLVSQHVRLDDLQAGVNRRNEQIDELRDRIAALEARARNGEDVADELRAVRAELRRQQDVVAATTRRGRLATFRLALTTAAPEAAAEPDGAIEHAARRALGLLGDALAGAIYVVILGGPLVLVGAVLWLLARRLRRRGNERLLDGR
ncbi:MAG TPA: DUF4349 domain-containing protein [Gaiellaceae bacterium]|nr:DUF4349 domain-containing protein [Gaiellaceae bacterium]